MSFDSILERALKKGKTFPVATGEQMDAAFAEVDLPDAPGYRKLLARSNGLSLGMLKVCGVGLKKPKGRQLDLVECNQDPYLEDVVGIIECGAAVFGWHTGEKRWVHALSWGVIAEYFDDDTAMIGDALNTQLENGTSDLA